MLSIWFKGHKDKEARKKELASFRRAFGELEEVLRKEYVPVPDPDYDNPAWGYKQAHINGQNQMLDRVFKLIDLKE